MTQASSANEDDFFNSLLARLRVSRMMERITANWFLTRWLISFRSN